MILAELGKATLTYGQVIGALMMLGSYAMFEFMFPLPENPRLQKILLIVAGILGLAGGLTFVFSTRGLP